MKVRDQAGFEIYRRALENNLLNKVVVYIAFGRR